jgi:hypothetical protein
MSDWKTIFDPCEHNIPRSGCNFCSAQSKLVRERKERSMENELVRLRAENRRLAAMVHALGGE